MNPTGWQPVVHMPKYVAFLRAINVGGHVVKMDQLRRLFETAGLTNVETFIASGNVIFDSKTRNTETLERKVEKTLEAALGYPVVTFVRSITEVQELAGHKPFTGADSETETTFIGFLNKAPDTQTLEKLQSLATLDNFHAGGRELFWLCRTKISDSKLFGPLLEKTLGARTTLRNSNTVKRIAAKYS
jgi:uncharacterized protein (DUF1697 family)